MFSAHVPLLRMIEHFSTTIVMLNQGHRDLVSTLGYLMKKPNNGNENLSGFFRETVGELTMNFTSVSKTLTLLYVSRGINMRKFVNGWDPKWLLEFAKIVLKRKNFLSSFI